MRKLLLFAAAAASSWSTAALAQPAGAPADDATRFVTTIIDKFNGGDTKALAAAQQDNAMIVDEFGPHMWAGPGSPKRWLDAYAQDAKENGVTGGRVDYGKPLQATSDGRPPMSSCRRRTASSRRARKWPSRGSMTFVMVHGAKAWKIASWTYSAAGTAAPEK